MGGGYSFEYNPGPPPKVALNYTYDNISDTTVSYIIPVFSF